MVRKNCAAVKDEGLCGGVGAAKLDHWMEDGQRTPNLGLSCTITLEPGSSVGEHFHHGDMEIYRMLSGGGEYNDNGTTVQVGAGDVLVCYDGEMHGLINTGDAPCVFDAIIVKS